jgi:L-iditol 2-dehydrogenase
VAVNPQIACGSCLACRSGRENICARRGLVGGSRPGGFAELVAVPLACAHPLSSDLDASVAVVCEPLATCVHALRLVPDSLTEVAVVFGAGAIGILAAQVLRAAGTRTIVMTELDEGRRQAALAFADDVAAPDEILGLAIELTGASARPSASTRSARTTPGATRCACSAGRPRGLARHERGRAPSRPSISS